MLMPPLTKEDLDAIGKVLKVRAPALLKMDWRWRLAELEALVALAAWRSRSIEERAVALADALIIDLGSG
jgi:hypothetical protein